MKLIYAFAWITALMTCQAVAQRQMEYLNRGLVAVNMGGGRVFLSWRMLGTEPDQIKYNIYRTTKGKTIYINSGKPLSVTNFTDSAADADTKTYVVKPVLNGKELSAGSGVAVLARDYPVQQYLSIPLDVPVPEKTGGPAYTYSANDASAADLDGEYEIILKWEPGNARNPPQTGITGTDIIDAYKLNGKRLWRINLGKNIRAGAAYTQFMVYDFDGDGKAEMICKTADGTIDGLGKPVGDSIKDWRTLSPPVSPFYGKVVNGPEYLTVFNGQTGAAMATVNYVPNRYPLNGWGGIGGNGGNDTTGGRSDRFTACVAYLDGVHPSAVFVRGWYGRSVLAAWNWRNGKLTSHWVFDSKDANNLYSGMGNHNLSVADVDGDGKDEICIGAMTVDHDGKGLYTTGLRHGDAIHLSDIDPEHPGLEVFGIHENEEKTKALNTPGVAMFDAATGKILFSMAPGVDVGRGVAADIDPPALALKTGVVPAVYAMYMAKP